MQKEGLNVTSLLKLTRRHGNHDATYHYHNGPHTLHTSLVNLREISVTNLSTFCADISHFPAFAAAHSCRFLSGKSQVQSDTPAPQTQHTCLLPLKLTKKKCSPYLQGIQSMILFSLVSVV